MRQLTLTMATSIVVANMIGTGVFTSLSFQAASMNSDSGILLLWILGGVIALTGALSYSELALRFPRSGGEYNYLSAIYHPSLGFVSGFVSIIVGFAAPVAAAAMAFGGYLEKIFPGFPPTYSAAIIVIVVSLIHSFDVKKGGRFQNVLTIGKICLILAFIFSALSMLQDPVGVSLAAGEGLSKDLSSPAFAVNLVWVYFAYSGWNAATYVSEEIEKPSRNIPLSLLVGTAIVTILYVGLNYAFLYSVPKEEMTKDLGNPDLAIGYLAGSRIFGSTGAMFMACLIGFGLISTISSMTIIGPRVTKRMGQDFTLFAGLSKTTFNNVPVISTWLQTGIALFFVFSSTFEMVTKYIGVTLSLFSMLTVIGLFIVRLRKDKTEVNYKTWLFPVTPLIFIALNLWMIIYFIKDEWTISLYSGITLLAGFLVWFVAEKLNKKNTIDEKNIES